MDHEMLTVFLSRCQNLNAWVAVPLLYETSGAYEPKGLSATPSGDVVRPFLLQGGIKELSPLLDGPWWRTWEKMMIWRGDSSWPCLHWSCSLESGTRVGDY